MSFNLSRGIIGQIIQTGQVPEVAIFQIVKAIWLENSNGPKKLKIELTDGIQSISGMISTQLLQFVSDANVGNFTVIRVSKMTYTNMAIVVLAFDVIKQLDYCLLPSANSVGIPQGAPPAQSYTSSNPYQQQNSPLKPPPGPQVYGSTYGSAVQTPYGSGIATGSTGSYPLNVYGAQQSVDPMSYGQIVKTMPGSYGNVPTSSVPGSNMYSTSTNNRPIIREDNLEQSIIPISALNPYANRWTIKARVTSKSSLKSWSNAKGEGTLFSIDLLDHSGVEIRATFFKEAASKFFGVIEESQVYLFSGGRVKVVANRQYSNIKNNYELTFDVTSDICPVSNDNSIKTQQFRFTKISALETVEPNETVDVIGIVKGFTEVAEIVSKNQGGKQLTKRDVTLIDTSGVEIRLTLWGDKATSSTINWNTSPIVAFKGVKVGDYGGRSLSSLSGTNVIVHPQIPEALELQMWRSQFPGGIVPDGVSLSTGASGGGGGERNMSMEPVENRKTISSIKDEGLGLSDKADYVVLKATINYIKRDNDPWYTACPTPACNKKVIESIGRFRCEKCNQDFDKCTRRFILNLTMADHSGNAWFSVFNEEAEKMLGMTADSLHEMRQAGQTEAYDEVFNQATFKTYIIKARVKQEMVKDEPRLKNTIVRMDKVDYVQESKLMLEAIQKYQ